MTQEDKELLLKYLCAILPYGVIVRHADYLVDSDGNYTGQFWYKRGYLYNICRLDSMTTTIIESEGSDEEGYEHICDLERSLPYLRPMTSMTEEEILELYKITYDTWYCDSLYYKNEEWINFRDSIKNNNLCFKTCIWLSNINKVINWLLKNHFDFMGLIPKGLAIEVTKENNPYKE